MRKYLYSLITDEKRGPLATFLKKIFSSLAILHQSLLAGYDFLWRAGILKGRKASLVVISVGNITLGGTGKTPFVKWLVEKLLERRKKIAILSRGYQKMTEDASDEVLELKKHFPDVPVWIGKDRVGLAKKASSAGMDAVILDDGFQYRWLSRDLDIVLIDATNPFGNGRVLPRGVLRERPHSLKRADLLVLSRVHEEDETLYGLERFLKGCAPEAPVLFSTHRIRNVYDARTGEAIPIESLLQEKGIGFCGIGNPKAFQHLLEREGIFLLEVLFFMDHHRYGKKDIEHLDRLAERKGATYLMTTEKDKERLHLLALWPKTRLVVVEVELVITKHEELLLKRLDTLFPR